MSDTTQVSMHEAHERGEHDGAGIIPVLVHCDLCQSVVAKAKAKAKAETLEAKAGVQYARVGNALDLMEKLIRGMEDLLNKAAPYTDASDWQHWYGDVAAELRKAYEEIMDASVELEELHLDLAKLESQAKHAQDLEPDHQEGY